MGASDSYKYLGILVGGNMINDTVLVNNATKLLDKLYAIGCSDLLPWQKITAIKMFLNSKLDFHFANCRSTHKLLDGIDKALRREVKRFLALPSSANDHFFYTPINKGGTRSKCSTILTRLSEG
eukprot:TRINITY_DN1092_c0_g1_i8.p3 TRINITY_DN1092_c0_g1~~TRINITY_DN1092_c0_g1_i8.p3  ORF type:complete len:124 (-),score=2.85 TRINITY_DN1092_c0_g1_i8:593-964(-)